MADVALLAELISQSKLPLRDEKETQAEMAKLFEANGIAFKREHRLAPGDIVDFFLDPGLAIEVKLNAQRPIAIARQLERYAQHDCVTALMLVTNRAVDFGPKNGKPVHVVSLGRAWL